MKNVDFSHESKAMQNAQQNKTQNKQNHWQK